MRKKINGKKSEAKDVRINTKVPQTLHGQTNWGKVSIASNETNILLKHFYRFLPIFFSNFCPVYLFFGKYKSFRLDLRLVY